MAFLCSVSPAAKCISQTVFDNQSSVITAFCKPDQFNDVATLFFVKQETAIRSLFHFDGEFGYAALFTFFASTFILSFWTYGLFVPRNIVNQTLIIFKFLKVAKFLKSLKLLKFWLPDSCWAPYLKVGAFFKNRVFR